MIRFLVICQLVYLVYSLRETQLLASIRLEKGPLTNNMKWVDAMGIRTKHISISNINGLRGILATENIVSDSCLVLIDSALTIETANNRPPSPCPDLCPQTVWERSMWDSRLAFVLLNELKSPVLNPARLEWLKYLPISFTTPVHWSDDMQNELQYQSLVDAISEQSNEWQRIYELWQNSLSSKLVKSVSYEEFVWAHECIKSRAFSGSFEGSTFAQRKALMLFTFAMAFVSTLVGVVSFEQSLSATALVAVSIFLRDFFSSRLAGLKRYVVCPFIDMFNHDSGVTSEVSFNYFTGAVELYVKRAHSKGEQVYINYGRQSNDRFLQFYGFVEENNPNDSYSFGTNILELVLRLGDILQSKGLLGTAPAPQERIQILSAALAASYIQDSAYVRRELASIPASESAARYYRTAPTANAVVAGDGVSAHFDPVTVAGLRAMCCTESEWKVLLPSLTLDALQRSSFNSDTNAKVNNALRLIAWEELKCKPTTLSEDIELRRRMQADVERPSAESSGDLGDPSGLFADPSYSALTFRIEKKKLLLEASQGLEL